MKYSADLFLEDLKGADASRKITAAVPGAVISKLIYLKDTASGLISDVKEEGSLSPANYKKLVSAMKALKDSMK